MNKDEFNKLDVYEQLNYINKKLKQGKSLRAISGELNISKSTIRNRFKKINYVFDIVDKQYIKIENYKTTTKVLKMDNNKEQEKYNNSDLVLFNKYKNDFLELMQLKDSIKELIQNNYKNIINVEPIELKINTEVLQGGAVNRSVKIYNNVYEELKELYKIYPEFKKYDLLSMAIHEFFLKYKK